MDPESSAAVPARLTHWRNELSAAAKAGKTVIIYLDEPQEVYRDTGERQYSGTGRNARKTTIVAEISTYAAIPLRIQVTARTGKEIKATSAASIINAYWKDFGMLSPYIVTIEGDYGTAVLQTPGVSRTVGAIARTPEGGSFLLLPPLRFNENGFTRTNRKVNESRWNAEGLKFGKRLTGSIVSIAKTLAAGAAVTPPPEWAADSRFATEAETQIKRELDELASKISALQKKRATAAANLNAAGALRHLLYEQGKPLEAAIVEALRLIGFAADGYQTGGSEFDVLFTSPEGRCLGEVEGKDTRPINIDKLSQLERNISEDFARDEVTEHAKGVLFGNAHRLSPPEERGDFFTEKCVSGAKRARIALVRTPDLFSVARYLKEHPDEAFADQCRQAIFVAEGEIVQFPAIPQTAGVG